MRGKGMLLGLILGLVALSGCETTRRQIKPPPRPEDYKLPPEQDARYNRPPRFPKETMNANRLVPRTQLIEDPTQAASFTDTQP